MDYVTVHCYPQEGSVSSSAVDSATELLRNESTRVFWDTNYVDPSWINNVIMLIPRLKNWVGSLLPRHENRELRNTIGAPNLPSMARQPKPIFWAFSEAKVLIWPRAGRRPPTNTPTYLAMKMYRNYDGNKSSFGDTSIQTVVPDPDDLSAFAAVRANDGAMTLIVINKDLNNATPISASITNFNAAGTVQRWQLTAANVISQPAEHYPHKQSSPAILFQPKASHYT